jgi:hypothetical protein
MKQKKTKGTKNYAAGRLAIEFANGEVADEDTRVHRT